MIAAVGLGALIGILLGLFGGGGSILAVPALVYGADLTLAAAVPTSLLVVGISSAVLLAGGALLPDVHEPAEWRAGHTPRARHIPLGQLTARLTEVSAG